MKRHIAYVIIACLCIRDIASQAIRDNAGPGLPVTKISVFSSGLAYYEHSGTLNGPAVISLPFKPNAVNDALMSLVLNDPASANPSVSYQSENTLYQTLRSLKIDLSDDPDIAVIMGRLRGEEIEIAVPAPVSGKIIGVERRPRTTSPAGGTTYEPWLSLYTSQGIRMFNFADISALNFKDPQLAGDLQRALDLIAASRNNDSRDLTVNLPGTGRRAASLSYVIPAPVWKVSYRLDLGRGAKPLFQGWAIIDNDGDSDWNNIELSLVAGRPASFIQNLYPPYYLSRPVLPLAIAGAAAAQTHDAAYAMPPVPAAAPAANARAKTIMMETEYSMASDEYQASAVASGVIETARGAAAGDQFEFTVKTPVSLDRRMSAMLPLVEASIEARKLLIFSGAGAIGVNHNPRLGAELTNTSGMKLPAGPITVYDGGTYAGDALIEFWNEGEKRLISYGEDLSVTGAIANTSTRTMVSTGISGGVMTFNRKMEYLKTYTIKNTAAHSKQLVIEHPKNQDSVLDAPEADEETPSSYRFNMTLPAGREITVLVRETRPLIERVSLLQLRQDAFVSYTTNQEIPVRVRDALRQAVNLRTAISNAESAVTEAERRRTGFISEQDRIRKNIEAAGSQSQQGQEYLRRLMSLDASIDAIAPELETLRDKVKSAQKAYEDYIGSLNL